MFMKMKEVYMLHTIYGFAPLIDYATLLNDCSFVPK